MNDKVETDEDVKLTGIAFLLVKLFFYPFIEFIELLVLHLSLESLEFITELLVGLCDDFEFDITVCLIHSALDRLLMIKHVLHLSNLNFPILTLLISDILNLLFEVIYSQIRLLSCSMRRKEITTFLDDYLTILKSINCFNEIIKTFAQQD